MSTLTLLNARMYVGGIDLGQYMNKLTLHASADEQDVTPFGSAGHVRMGGLRDWSVDHEGFAQYVDPDATLFADLATQRQVTMCPVGTDGDIAYFGQAMRLDYTPLDGAVGDPAAFQGTVMASDAIGLIRGQLLLPKQTVTAAGVTGTGQQMGLVGATQKLYTAIHCLSAGTTATVIVESDDNSGFTSAITRSSTVVTAAGGTWVVPVAGAIASDVFWRVRVATVTGSFSLAVAVGIQ